MKDVILTLLTLPFVFLIFYLFGLLASRPKTKLKLFSIGLFISLITSFPITGKFIEFPLVFFAKKIKNNNLFDIKSIIVLTGGIYQNTLGDWRPSQNTEKRILMAKKILKNKNIPLIISGGSTKNNGPSEAALAKKYFNLNNSIIEEKSLNTYQSAINLKQYCSNHRGSLLLITDPYHSLRSYLTFKTQNCNIILPSYEINIAKSDFKPSIRGYVKINKAIYEYLGLMYYIISFKISLL